MWCEYILDKEFEYGGTIAELEHDKGNYKGIYIIVLPDSFQTIYFEEHSNAGKFKGKNPTVSVDDLKKKWVDGAKVLYIGKSERNVQKRMQKHINFWNGKPVPAWGGRTIAQIGNFENLEVWYLPCDNPKAMETALLNEFKMRYKKLPFANLRC